jgi:23S rRNA pseudouridine2605 synthase
MKKTIEKPGLVTLNTYLAHAGICSRRKAAELVASGVVQVNQLFVRDPGYRVKPDDVVEVSGKNVMPEEHVYIVLNKPKDYVTTVSDERGRKTVMDLVADAGRVRLYPIGRLDRTTTGLLLMTNDGFFAQKLAHPRYEVEKIYSVTLDRNLSAADMQAITRGVELDDGLVRVDDIAYTGATKREITLILHSGKYRVVRRIFEHLGYDVRKLDRISYAGLTKKRLPVGMWRYLTKHEVAELKNMRKEDKE